MKTQSRTRLTTENRRIKTVAHATGTIAAAVVFAAVAVLPLSIDGGTIGLNSAQAVGNGNGNGGNGSNGQGRGDENGGGNSSSGGGGNTTANAGSLNAAHASAQGLTHANENSRPGALREYMEALVEYEAEYALVDWVAYDALVAEIGTKNLEIEGLETDIAALDPEDANYLTDKATLEGQIATLEGDISVLQGDADALTADLDAAADVAAGSLQDAANKDGLIDPAIIDATNSLLDGKSDSFTHSTVVHDSEQDIADIINPPTE